MDGYIIEVGLEYNKKYVTIYVMITKLI